MCKIWARIARNDSVIFTTGKRKTVLTLNACATAKEIETEDFSSSTLPKLQYEIVCQKPGCICTLFLKLTVTAISAGRQSGSIVGEMSR